MRIFICSVSCLIGVVAIASVIGYGATHNHWGDAGVRSMLVIAVICLCAAILGALPTLIVAPRWPAYIGQAVLAGTTVRLLLTGAAAYAYQEVANPPLGPYLMWASIYYLLLLAVESIFGVVAVRRFYRTAPETRGAVA